MQQLETCGVCLHLGGGGDGSGGESEEEDEEYTDENGEKQIRKVKKKCMSYQLLKIFFYHLTITRSLKERNGRSRKRRSRLFSSKFNHLLLIALVVFFVYICHKRFNELKYLTKNHSKAALEF